MGSDSSAGYLKEASMSLSHILSSVVGGIGILKVVWKKWDIRSFIIASFTFQLVLIVAAPFRKRTSNIIARATIWGSYLLADWVAAQAVGLITRATEAGAADAQPAAGELFSFWAQFLLLHLGGPDTITALALEDNELWLRTALHLGTQVYATLALVFGSMRLRGSLWAPTVLMFVVGIIKYLERVLSLFRGRLTRFDESKRDRYILELTVDQSKQELTSVDMVRHAFSLWSCYERLYADRRLGPKVRESAQEYFRRRTPEEAYRVVAIQLNFTYEAIYTKMAVVHTTTWNILRHVVLLLEAACLVIWCVSINKKGYPPYDVRITYTLVVGAVAVDVLAFLRIHLSDWNIARLKKESRIRSWLYKKLLDAAWTSSAQEKSSIWWFWFRKVFMARWSESVCQFKDVEKPGRNMRKAIECLGIEDLVYKHHYVTKKWFSSDIWDFIFKVVSKSQPAGMDAMVARALPIGILDHGELVEIWSAIAVQLYGEEVGRISKDEGVVRDGETENGSKGSNVVAPNAEYYQHISTTLSLYLCYLFFFQPNMMFAAAGKEKVTQLYDDLKGKFYIQHSIEWEEREVPPISEEERNMFAILSREVATDRANRRRTAEGRMKDVIDYVKCSDGDEEKKAERWEVIARVLVELLCYAAGSCRPNVHAEQLKQGGELLTFVWLLMVHLGVGIKTPSII